MATNTKLTYLYRDASNYKEYHEVVLKGKLTRQEVVQLKECLENSIGDSNGFIPKQVGLEDLQAKLQAYDSKYWEDDHPWHELLSLVPTNEPGYTENGTIKALLQRFLAVKGKWNSAYEVPHILKKGAIYG